MNYQELSKIFQYINSIKWLKLDILRIQWAKSQVSVFVWQRFASEQTQFSHLVFLEMGNSLWRGKKPEKQAGIMVPFWIHRILCGLDYSF